MSNENTKKNLNSDELEFLLEAAFFALSRPLRINELADIISKDERDIRSIVKKIRAKLKKGGYAFKVDEIATDVYMMRINESLEDPLKDILEEENIFKFNQIEIEVLTNVAYQQPVRKSNLPKMIDGLNKSDILKALDMLLINDYITESTEKNAVILRTTSKFALEFGFSTELRQLKQQLHWRLKRNA